MNVSVMLVEDEIKRAIVEYISANYGVRVSREQLVIHVKSKQNYKAEWEQAIIKVECSLSAEPV